MKKLKLLSIAIALSVLTSMSALSVPAYSKGDANKDGKVNVRDCAYIASALAQGKSSSLSDEADYNNDGSKNVRDAAKLASDLAKGILNIGGGSINETIETDFEYKGTLPTGGDTFTIMAWTGDDLDYMIDEWAASEGIDRSEIHIINLGVGGSEAPGLYDRYFLGDENIDAFLVEPDWALKFLDDNTATAPLSELGFTNADFADQYSYTLELGKSSDGVLKAVSFNPYPGGWCYRTDLAKKYLGVTSPEEMQTLVCDWDSFLTTAEKVSNASNNKTALTTSIGGMWNAYSCSRPTAYVNNNTFKVTDFFTKFIKLAKTMTVNNYTVPDSYQWMDTWYQAGQTDATMGYFASTWGFGPSILETAAGGEEGETYGKWNVCQGPNAYNWGGTHICVSPETDNADLVASFIDYFTVNKSTMKNYFEKINNPDVSGVHHHSGYVEFVNSQSLMQEYAENNNFSSGVFGGQNDVAIMHETAQNIDLDGIITPYDSAVSIAFNSAVNGYCLYDSISTEQECIEYFKNKLSEDCPELTIK